MTRVRFLQDAPDLQANYEVQCQECCNLLRQTSAIEVLWMARVLKTVVRLSLHAGKATPAPPVGPALGQHGLNIAAFCKDYNAQTSGQIGFVVPADISVYEDRTYTFVLKTPLASGLLLRSASIEKGSPNPNKLIVGSITTIQLEEIAIVKLPDLNTNKIASGMRTVAGTAKSMGVSITD